MEYFQESNAINEDIKSNWVIIQKEIKKIRQKCRDKVISCDVQPNIDYILEASRISILNPINIQPSVMKKVLMSIH